jgi:hypothetical protein
MLLLKNDLRSAEPCVPYQVDAGLEAVIAYNLYKLFLKLDLLTDNYEDFEGEDLPYCGHHWSGHNGKFTTSYFREGDGRHTLRFFLLWEWTIVGHTDEGWFFGRANRRYAVVPMDIVRNGRFDYGWFNNWTFRTAFANWLKLNALSLWKVLKGKPFVGLYSLKRTKF